MDLFDDIQKGICPNGCGELSILKVPIYVWEQCPMEVLEAYYESQAGKDDEEDFDHIAIVAICTKCSFVLSNIVKDEDRPHVDDGISSIQYGETKDVDRPNS